VRQLQEVRCEKKVMTN